MFKMYLKLFIVLSAIFNFMVAYSYSNPLLDEKYWKTATVQSVEQHIKNGADVNARLEYASASRADPPFPIVGKKPVNTYAKETIDGLTPLMIAVANNADVKIIEMLIKHGADVNAFSMEGFSGRAMNPLMIAIDSDQSSDVIDILINNGADVKRRLKKGLTALHYAVAKKDNLATIKKLIKHGADVNTLGVYHSRHGSTITPLMVALNSNQSSDVIDILINNGADVKLSSKHDGTALHIAVKRKYNLATIKKLIKHGAVHVEDFFYAHTPLSAALYNGVSMDVIDALLDLCAKDTTKSACVRNILPKTRGNFTDLDIIKKLIQYGADINARYAGYSLLGWAVIRKNPRIDLVKFLIKHGADINFADSSGKTILMRAVDLSMVDGVKILIDHGVKTNAKDKMGRTALFWALDGRIITLLVKGGIDISVKDKSGQRAFTSIALAYRWEVKKIREHIQLYRAGAEQGHPNTQYYLGHFYHSGDVVLKDYKQAVYWYKKSAKQGHAMAQFRLGAMYAKGFGVAVNHKLAYMWSNISAYNGNEQAKKNLNIIEKELTPLDIEKAQEFSQLCLSSEYQICDFDKNFLPKKTKGEGV